MRRLPLIPGVAATVLSALAITACGSSTSNAPTAASPATTTPTAPAGAPAKPGTIAVSLGAPTEFSLSATPAAAASGPVTFQVGNDGSLTHELVVVRTDAKAAALPVSGSKASESGSAGETGDLAPGATKPLTLKLPVGHYALICNLPGHFAGGMHADFVVR